MRTSLGLLFAALICGMCVSIASAQSADDKVLHAAEQAAENAAKGNLMSIDPDLAWWTLGVFVILLLVLKKFAWGPILEALEGRENHIANHIAQAERNHEEAKRLLAEYEQKLASAANEVRGMMDEARRDAEHAKQAIVAEGRAGAEAERVRALREIESATDAALETLSKRSAQLAVDLAGKILQSKLSEADHERLIKEAMAKFPASSTN